MTPTSDEIRALARLRSACRSPEAKELLHRALDRGWPALAIEELAKGVRGPAACRNMLDCDRLQDVLDAGWTAADIKYLARQHSAVVGRRVPGKETPGAIRLALALIEGRPAGQYGRWFPRPNQTN
jgi:hypothetical protein